MSSTLIENIRVCVSDDQDIDVMGHRPGLAGVPGGPGPVDERFVDTFDASQESGQHGERAEGDREQIGQRAGEQ
ncbi:hypothetical protein [Nocardioides sp. AE5]|uniref:hypothetical protein n=1 Tax=Nocardioides sp. AE5 TaxID=2962573 RepID=UPI0028828A82|nr:hypothetical protein [Nocardioides sp. AE5]MDT0201648.1 hypothetical protein [Nocardioides sp. AE5]